MNWPDFSKPPPGHSTNHSPAPSVHPSMTEILQTVLDGHIAIMEKLQLQLNHQSAEPRLTEIFEDLKSCVLNAVSELKLVKTESSELTGQVVTELGSIHNVLSEEKTVLNESNKYIKDAVTELKALNEHGSLERAKFSEAVDKSTIALNGAVTELKSLIEAFKVEKNQFKELVDKSKREVSDALNDIKTLKGSRKSELEESGEGAGKISPIQDDLGSVESSEDLSSGEEDGPKRRGKIRSSCHQPDENNDQTRPLKKKIKVTNIENIEKQIWGATVSAGPFKKSKGDGEVEDGEDDPKVSKKPPQTRNRRQVKKEQQEESDALEKALEKASGSVNRVLQRGWDAANSSDAWVYKSNILLPNGFTPMPPLRLDEVASDMASELGM